MTLVYDQGGFGDPAKEPNMLAKVQANVAKQLLLSDLLPTIETDFDEYIDLVDKAPAWADKKLGIIDPEHNTLGPKNAFWVAIRNSQGDVVTCCAQRIWQNSGLVELVDKGQLMYDGTKEPGNDNFRLFTGGLGHIKGNIAFSGGGWVHPAVRGSALPTLALVLAQAKLIQDFSVDYCFSIVREELVTKGVVANTYRFRHMDFGGTLWHQTPSERLEVWVIHNNRADMERELTLWSSANN